jgi:hypothetical protein
MNSIREYRSFHNNYFKSDSVSVQKMGLRTYWDQRTALQSNVLKCFSPLLCFVLCELVPYLCRHAVFHLVVMVTFFWMAFIFPFFPQVCPDLKNNYLNLMYLTGFGVLISRSGICLVSSCFILFSWKSTLRNFLRIEVLFLNGGLISSRCDFSFFALPFHH